MNLRYDRSILPAGAVCALLALTLSCSEAPKPKAPEKPVEPVTGRYALQQMFVAARTWAQDLQIVSLTSLHFPQVPAVAGKSGGWQVVFASPSLQQSRTYTYAVMDISASIHQGIGEERPERWPGGKSFPFAAVKLDSDEAYQIAVKKVTKYAEAHPDMTILYQLQMNQTVPDAVWRIIWGENASTSADSVLVDASTGQYMGTLH